MSYTFEPSKNPNLKPESFKDSDEFEDEAELMLVESLLVISDLQQSHTTEETQTESFMFPSNTVGIADGHYPKEATKFTDVPQHKKAHREHSGLSHLGHRSHHSTNGGFNKQQRLSTDTRTSDESDYQQAVPYCEGHYDLFRIKEVRPTPNDILNWDELEERILKVLNYKYHMLKYSSCHLIEEDGFLARHDSCSASIEKVMTTIYMENYLSPTLVGSYQSELIASREYPEVVTLNEPNNCCRIRLGNMSRALRRCCGL